MGVISESNNTIRRLVGAYPIYTSITLDVQDPTSINDLQTGLDMNLTGLTSYHTKQESDNRNAT